MKLRKRMLWQWVLLAGIGALVGASSLGCSGLGVRIDKLTLLVTGNAIAYVKDCGCATGQTGGVLRQMRVARQEKASAIEEGGTAGIKSGVVLIEMGNFSDPSTPVKRIESDLVLKAFKSLDYDIVGLGSKELTWPQDVILPLLKQYDLPLTAANLTFIAPKPSISADQSAELNALIQKYRIITLSNGFKVGVIHAIQSGTAMELGDMYGYRLERPADAVKTLLAAHKPEADYWLLTVSDADKLGSRTAGLEKLVDINVIIGFDEASRGAQSAARPVLLNPPFEKAKDLHVVKQYFEVSGEPGVVEQESRALRADIKFDEELDKVWQGMQQQLIKLATDEANALILARATAKPPFHVGQNNCIECHKEIVDAMSKTKHAQAFVTLVNKQVENNASCVKCHVVGYGAPWGWNVKENQPNLQAVQCENCHGPASYHLDIYKKKEIPRDLMADGRDKYGLLPAGEQACVKCHDVDNSPKFNYATYWEMIRH